jgi:hypothetical protein
MNCMQEMDVAKLARTKGEFLVTDVRAIDVAELARVEGGDGVALPAPGGWLYKDAYNRTQFYAGSQPPLPGNCGPGCPAPSMS